MRSLIWECCHVSLKQTDGRIAELCPFFKNAVHLSVQTLHTHVFAYGKTALDVSNRYMGKSLNYGPLFFFLVTVHLSVWSHITQIYLSFYVKLDTTIQFLSVKIKQPSKNIHYTGVFHQLSSKTPKYKYFLN